MVIYGQKNVHHKVVMHFDEDDENDVLNVVLSKLGRHQAQEKPT